MSTKVTITITCDGVNRVKATFTHGTTIDVPCGRAIKWNFSDGKSPISLSFAKEIARDKYGWAISKKGEFCPQHRTGGARCEFWGVEDYSRHPHYPSDMLGIVAQRCTLTAGHAGEHKKQGRYLVEKPAKEGVAP